MPNYFYKCNQCSFTKNIFMSIIEYSNNKDLIFCKCNEAEPMPRVYHAFESDIEISPDDRLCEIKKEAKKIAKKIINGDSILINNFYGN